MEEGLLVLFVVLGFSIGLLPEDFSADAFGHLPGFFMHSI